MGRGDRRAGESAGSGFSLVLLLVGREGQDAIRSWLERGRTGAGFPGFEAIPESSRLDVARGLTTRG